MCLAIPGKIVEIYKENDLLMGKIDYSGALNQACLEYVPEAKTGNYVVVHAGFAISLLDEKEAMKSLEAWSDVADKLEEQGYTVSNAPVIEKKSKSGQSGAKGEE